MAKQVRGIRIQSLARADAILETLAAGPKSGHRLRDIAAATRLAPSTAATLLQSLVGLRQVEKSAVTGRYRLGRRLLQLGRMVEAQIDLLELGRPVLIRLCQTTGETVNLTVPASTTMIVAESLEGDVRLKTTALKGIDLPLYGTASGKCYLAFTSSEIRQTLLRLTPFTRLTARTIGDLARLEDELAAIRRLGYATEEDEFHPGVIAVAAPILNPGGKVLGTLSIHGPSDRLTARRIVKLGGLVKHETKRISALLP